MAISEFDQALMSLKAVKLKEGEEVAPGVCYGCGGKTKMGVINYEQDLLYSGGVRLTLARMLPGEVCSAIECGATFRLSGLDNRFREAAAKSFALLGDSRLQRQQDRLVRRLDGVITTPIPQEVLERLETTTSD